MLSHSKFLFSRGSIVSRCSSSLSIRFSVSVEAPSASVDPIALLVHPPARLLVCPVGLLGWSLSYVGLIRCIFCRGACPAILILAGESGSEIRCINQEKKIKWSTQECIKFHIYFIFKAILQNDYMHSTFF